MATLKTAAVVTIGIGRQHGIVELGLSPEHVVVHTDDPHEPRSVAWILAPDSALEPGEYMRVVEDPRPESKPRTELEATFLRCPFRDPSRLEGAVGQTTLDSGKLRKRLRKLGPGTWNWCYTFQLCRELPDGRHVSVASIDPWITIETP